MIMRISTSQTIVLEVSGGQGQNLNLGRYQAAAEATNTMR
jgi:hypothetical protein